MSNNLNVQKTVEPKEFVKEADEYDNHIHLIPDVQNRGMKAYLHVGEAGSGEVVETVLTDVSYRLHYENDEKEIDSWFLTGSESDNFLAFLTCLKWERTETRITIDWYEESGMRMMEDAKFGEEKLTFKYRTESGNKKRVHNDSIYRRNAKGVQMMANFK